MDENKLKSAFLKVKTQINKIELKIDKLNSLQNSYLELYDGVENNYQLILELQKKETSNDGLIEIQSQLNQIKEDQSQLNQLFEKTIESINLNSFEKKKFVQKEDIEEVSEILKENLIEQTNKLKSDITKEISKIYDTFYNEILDLKKEINTLKNQHNKEISKKIPIKTKTLDEKKQNFKEEKKSESKIKKAIKWLFVDEEEDFDIIKQEVKFKKEK